MCSIAAEVTLNSLPVGLQIRRLPPPSFALLSWLPNADEHAVLQACWSSYEPKATGQASDHPSSSSGESASVPLCRG